MFLKRYRALHDGAQALAPRTIERAQVVRAEPAVAHTERAGRKAHKIAE